MKHQPNWNIDAFNDLEVSNYHHIMALRSSIFVVEQNCPYQDIDDKDLTAFHVYGKLGQQVIAVCRILPAGISYSEISIGRVAVSMEYRGTNVANDLMHQTLYFIENKWGTQDIRISAQHHLTSFYSRFDFIQVSEIYLEDDIPHVEMIRTAKNH
jgi:ElaA protein